MKDREKYKRQQRTKHSVPKGKKGSSLGDNRRKISQREKNDGAPSRDIYNQVSAEEFEKIQMENKRLRQLNKTIQRENNKVMSLERDGRIDAFDETFKTTVIAVTKQVVYPRCPYISNPVQLDKCTLILAAELELTESKKRWF